MLRPHLRALLAVMGISATLCVPMALSGLIIARALDEGFLVRRTDLGLLWLAVLVQVQLAAAVLSRALFAPLVRVVEPFRDRLVSAVAMAGLDRALLDGAPVAGASVQQATDEAELARRLVGTILRNIHTTLSVAAGAVIGLATLAPVAALAPLACLVAAGGAYRLLVRLSLRWQRRALVAEEGMSEQASRLFTHRRDVVAFAAERTASRPVYAGIRDTRRATLTLDRIGTLRAITASLGVDVAMMLLLALAPVLMSTGRLSSGDLVAAVFYVMFGLGPAVRFLVYGGAGWLVSLLAVASRLGEILDATPTVAPGRPGDDRSSGSAPSAPVSDASVIELDGVTFRYAPAAAPVLDAVTLAIPRGAHVAVVGPSGAGKSTLAAIVCGLLEPTHGQVRVAGAPTAEQSGHAGEPAAPVAPRSGRAADQAEPAAPVVLVPQEAYVFAGTLRENLCYLAPSRPTGAVLTAARLFGLDGVLRRGGLDGELPPGGAGMSAGERQLIALVRTYLSAAPVVILDEATSHLDPSTEQRVESLFARRGGTLIVIAHRISSARRADQVLLVDAGRVVAGTHETLCAGSGRYRELVGHWEVAPDRLGGAQRAAAGAFRPGSGFTIANEEEVGP